ncbi:TPA: energy-coupling factor ABC transporter ATP-binding protein [bacterium]|nr:energy-coupling factor ABC transporter ATP-binding protein [bacterium]
MKTIKTDSLIFTYRNSCNRALDSIEFEINEGEMVAIMGKAGVGKSTLCRCLNGIIPNFVKGDLSGNISILGESIKNKQIYEIAKNVGLVFQDFESQLFSTSVELEVAFGPENLAIPSEEIRERVNYALKAVGLEGFENRQPYNLSGGEKQRLAIASVLSSKPKIIVLDEPTTDLDPKGRYDILSSLENLKKESMSILLVEHEIEDILNTDKLIIMNSGKIILFDETSAILRNIEVLENNSIRPPQIAKLCSEIGSDKIYITAQEAYNSGISLNFDDEKYQTLIAKENERQYGNVAIEVNDLKYSFPDGKNALNKIDLSIKEGEFVAIIGQNGSGKTTLAKCFNGLLKPSFGKVNCFGKDTTKMKISELGKLVGYVFQNPDHQIFANTVREELMFGPKNFGLSEEQIKTNIEEALQAVHLEGYEELDPFSLTKGERQRVAVASVLACKPQILILDEPTTGLDYPQQKSMMELLKSLNESGHTIIIITHSLWVVAEYAHRVIVMDKGFIKIDGNVRDVFCQQDKLESVGMRLPELIKLSNMLGKKLLSVEEYKKVISKERNEHENISDNGDVTSS